MPPTPSDAEPTIRCNATIALAKCAMCLPEAVRDKVIASSMQKVGRVVVVVLLVLVVVVMMMIMMIFIIMHMPTRTIIITAM